MLKFAFTLSACAICLLFCQNLGSLKIHLTDLPRNPIRLNTPLRAAQNAVMKTNKPIQIFKPGKHTAMSGAALSFSETDLAATAAAYDPAKHEAPLVCGHPKHDGPAYGWVNGLSFADGALEAAPSQVNADFAELVTSGAFKKISASFYSPDSPSNPVPGVYYLRHVGFLGAQPPAVKGLRNPSFADSEQGVVEFSEWDDVENAGMWRSLREWFINKFGLEEADKAISSWSVSALERGAQDELRESQTAEVPAPAFTEKGSNEVSPEEKAALEAENASLKKQVADAAARDKAAQADARHTANTNFAEGLVKAGTLLPAHKDIAVATLDFLEGGEKIVEFGEGDAKKPLADAFKGLLQAMPKVVNFGESAPNASGITASTVEFAAPHGADVNQELLELHHKALAFMEQHTTTDYLAAYKSVGGK